LKNNFRRGAGARKIAAAIYFWFHSFERYKSHAVEIDRIVFGKPFSEAFPDLKIPTKSSEALKTTAQLSSSPASVNLPDVSDLRSRLDVLDLKNQRFACLVQLAIQIEEIMGRKELLLANSRELSETRGCFALKNAWIDPDSLRSVQAPVDKWYTTHRKPVQLTEFSLKRFGRKFIAIDVVGTRLSTNVLHQINTWFSLLFQLLNEEVLKPKDIDVVIRYILVFASFRRAAFMKFYFNDEAEKFEYVLRSALSRAAYLDLNLRDYGPLDEEYRQYFHLSKR